jgi:hypothetical protein
MPFTKISYNGVKLFDRLHREEKRGCRKQLTRLNSCVGGENTNNWRETPVPREKTSQTKPLFYSETNHRAIILTTNYLSQAVGAAIKYL